MGRLKKKDQRAISILKQLVQPSEWGKLNEAVPPGTKVRIHNGKIVVLRKVKAFIGSRKLRRAKK